MRFPGLNFIEIGCFKISLGDWFCNGMAYFWCKRREKSSFLGGDAVVLGDVGGKDDAVEKNFMAGVGRPHLSGHAAMVTIGHLR